MLRFLLGLDNIRLDSGGLGMSIDVSSLNENLTYRQDQASVPHPNPHFRPNFHNSLSDPPRETSTPALKASYTPHPSSTCTMPDLILLLPNLLQ
jgi:hypothetical protein